MAQQMIMDFMGELTEVLDLPEPIVEFGSLQVEPGQPNDLRPLLADRAFVGTDIRSGPGVDRVEDLRSLTFGDGEIGTAVCLDTLEHCADPLTACREMHRVLRDGGICVISSVMLFVIHGYPADYWRFTPEGFRTLLAPFDDIWVTGIGHPALPTQVIGIATKGRRIEPAVERFSTLSAAQKQWERPAGNVRFGAVHVPLAEVGATLVREIPRVLKQRASARLGTRRRP